MDQHNKINFDLPLEFKITRPVECPYLDARMEQRLAADITSKAGIHDNLARAGFRRIENWVYKPVCTNCSACVPIRIASGNIDEGNLNISRNQRRVINRNSDLDRQILPNISIYEHYELFSKYLDSRHHDGQMADMPFGSYNEMITASPIETRLMEYKYNGDVVGVMLIDIQDDGISSVYSFFDPDASDRSLGTYMVLDSAALAYEMGLDYVYLGYFIENSSKMNYKSRFSPAEYLIGGNWVPAADKKP
jgi:arginine-tRNA-protein transferase